MKNLEFKLLNLKKAYAKLQESCALYNGDNEIIRDSVIQRFEFTYELSHKTLREFMNYMGISTENTFPRSIFKKAYANHIIDDDKLWINLMEDRNRTSHVYSEDMSNNIADRIKNEYVFAIGKMINKIEENI